jgi:dTMP kinase
MSNGFFLTFEGIEGSGKTTQLQKLAKLLREPGSVSVCLTKEPGGTPLANRIRAILLDPEEDGMDPVTEVLLYAASRRQHTMEVIRPALDGGAIVLCDRFTDATLAYQGFGRTLNLDRLRALNDWATERTYPDLTLIYDLPESIGLDRARARNDASEALRGESRIEGEDLRFHRRVREGYRSLAEADSRRYAVVDANGTIDEVFERTLSVLATRAPQLPLPVRPTA